MIHTSARVGFEARADSYVKGRPSYPEALVAWLRNDLGLGAGTTVLDLGAGTGKFLPLLKETGAVIVAVEPVAAMRAQLASLYPDIEAKEGSADAIPLDTASVDAVVCAQSFHWFATREALAEILRVLRPGGRLGLVWNERDESTPWVAALTDIIRPYLGDAPSQRSQAWRALFPADGFGPLRETYLNHGHRGAPEQVIVERVLSTSYIAALPEAEQAKVVAQVRALIASSPDLAGKQEVVFPYRTDAFSCTKIG